MLCLFLFWVVVVVCLWHRYVLKLDLFSPLITAVVADSEKLKCVKDQLEIVCFRSRYLKFMDWALIQRLGGSTTHAGEVVLVSLDRRVQRFSRG